VEILSRQFGMIDVSEQDYLRVLRIGNLTLQELYDTLQEARESRVINAKPALEQAPLPKRFTYIDCTDYIDRDDPEIPDVRKNWLPLLTFAKWCKEYNADARLPWYSHLHLLFAYVAYHQKPNVHGGYFEGMLSQQLIYRLACLGYDETVATYGSEVDLSIACEERQIRMLVSPMLWTNRNMTTVPPPSPVVNKPRTASAVRLPQQQPSPSQLPAAVPDLVNKSIVAARADIAAINARTRGADGDRQLLLLEITRSADGMTPGTVLEQSPAAGTPLQQRTSIEVIVAKR
jgi:hypothetical protein